MKEVKTTDSVNISEFLWKVIQRFDVYIATTNAKAAMVVAFDTFVFGAIILKWQDVLASFGLHRTSVVIAGFLLAAAAMASLFSLWETFRVVSPFVKSPKSPTKYHSTIFFGHVSEHNGPDEYQDSLKVHTQESISKDLGTQAHVLAQGLNYKFQCMKLSIGAILFVQLPSLVLMVVIKLIATIADILAKGVNP